jgi:hypothetical protein
MPALDLPLFGNVVLCAILVSAAYTFAGLPIGDLTTRVNWFHQNEVNFSP